MALQLLVAPINMRVLFTNEPADDHYCHAIADGTVRETVDLILV